MLKFKQSLINQLIVVTMLFAMISIGILLFSISLTYATSSKSKIGISANVEPACTISASDLNFGSYYNNVFVTAIASITLRCTNGTQFAIALDQGLNTKETSLARKMSNNKKVLDYGLYQDSASTNVWGSGNNVVKGVGTGRKQIFTIYGKIFENQKAPIGSYSDSVNVSLNINNAKSPIKYQFTLAMNVNVMVRNK